MPTISQAMPDQTVLAIDTSGPRLQLALAAGGTVDTLIEDLPKGHAEVLFARLQTLLDRNGLSYENLTRLAVTTGPGSFTGLRIGIAAARGLGLALGIPVIGVPTLFAMSLGAKQDHPLSIAVDARRGEAYRQDFIAPGQPANTATLVPVAMTGDVPLVESVNADIGATALFAVTADPAQWPPDPAYIRAADAKPQEGFAVAHAPGAAS